MRRPLTGLLLVVLSGTASGVNGHARKHAAVKLHYLHTACAADVVINGDQRDSEGALTLQFQQSS